MTQRIAVSFLNAKSPFVGSAVSMLRRNFADYEIDVFDVARAVKRDRRLVSAAMVHAVRLYGMDLLRGQRLLRRVVYRTPFMFHAMNELVRRRFTARSYTLGFQIQSVFDGSLPGVPHFIYTDHTHLANLSYPGFKQRELYAQPWIDLERQTYRHATRTFTWSAHVSRSLNEQYGCPPERIACVYTGSNVPIVDEPLQNDSYRNKSILFVGVDWERKGGPDLLAAFEQVLQKHPDARLTIVGVKPWVTLPNVQTVGKVPLAEVPRFYRDASIFCLPTLLEPFGIVFVEALAYRLPVVGTNIGAVPDFVTDGETGLLVNPGDRDALARRLIELLDSPDLCRRFGERGHAIALDRYTWDRVGERIRGHVHQALAGSGLRMNEPAPSPSA